MAMSRKEFRDLATGIGFLLPNILGFLAFTMIPLAYYIYNEGFSTGRLGYASAVSWMLFFLVFLVTIFNWKFGNRYTND